MIGLLRRYLCLGTVGPGVPPGMVADKSAIYGLIALLSNINAYSQTRADVTTAGTDSTLTAAQAIAGSLFLAAGASGGFTITLPSTKSIIAAFGPTIPTDGTFSKIITITNVAVGQTGTLTAGDGSTTITGTATIATNTSRRFVLTINSASTVTFQNTGSSSL